MIIADFVDIFTHINKNTLILVELKKLFSIFLITLLILNSAGYVMVYFQLKSSYQKEALLKLESYTNKEDLMTITLSRSELENENYRFIEQNEIMYFGRMYDISHIEYSEDSIKITALCDEKEDKLNNLFDLFFTKNLNDIFTDTENINDVLISEAGLPIKFTGIPSRENDVLCNFVFVPLLNNFMKVPSPPPKYFS